MRAANEKGLRQVAPPQAMVSSPFAGVPARRFRFRRRASRRRIHQRTRALVGILVSLAGDGSCISARPCAVRD